MTLPSQHHAGWCTNFMRCDILSLHTCTIIALKLHTNLEDKFTSFDHPAIDQRTPLLKCSSYKKVFLGTGPNLIYEITVTLFPANGQYCEHEKQQSRDFICVAKSKEKKMLQPLVIKE